MTRVGEINAPPASSVKKITRGVESILAAVDSAFVYFRGPTGWQRPEALYLPRRCVSRCVSVCQCVTEFFLIYFLFNFAYCWVDY